MSRWFRHYAGMCRDDKLVRAALRSKQTVERVIWVYAAILESAAEVNDGGRYDLDAEEAAYFLRADVLDIKAIENALHELGRLDAGRVAKWGDRQFLSDNSAERVRSHRERAKSAAMGGEHGNGPRNAEHVGSERPCNGDVTLQKRPGNAPETETETETETEKKKARARERAAEFLVFWQAYPRKVARDAAAKAYLKARDKADPDTILVGLERYKRHKPDYADWAHASSWLNAGRWADEYGDPPKPGEAPPVLVPEHKTQEEADLWWASRFERTAGAA